MRFESQVPARIKHHYRVGDVVYAEFACWRCGWKLGDASAEVYPGHALHWMFGVPPGFMPVWDGDPSAPDVIRPTKKRRQEWRKLRRKAETSSLARIRLKSGSEAIIPYRDPDTHEERGALMTVLLPRLMECERCHTINRLEPPS
ncbi:hypothetical protein NET02_15935 [Thermomicrobiaceae bacterium CFH 74404]|uniref:Uncharacterized protein n=1 Tax=Thermalbibacter longus TaxID=2951981 RepID=A0AA41WCG6_9BACT|nr:hypothetical protein [Thermalbibacter longus]MCM8750634.1 hypothetical protein [Thermalbibacter longus]